MSVFTRLANNPILTRDDVPDAPPDIIDATSVFNPGAVLVGGEYVLLLRVQTRGRRTRLAIARGSDGRTFAVDPEPVEIPLGRLADSAYHVYDPRVTRVGNAFYVTLAVDTDDGCRLGLTRTEDLRSFEEMAVLEELDVRNGVLFPERVGGDYLLLSRPNNVTTLGGATTGDSIELSRSSDLRAWSRVGPVMSGRPHYWDELIGSGPPPVKTREGWLHVYHGVARHLASAHVYQAGVVLLDLEDPSKVVARGGDNVLEPREPYELTGQVPNVVFPTGLVVDDIGADGFAPPGSRVLLYYGAADTCVCAAESTVDRLLGACGRP